MSSPVFTPGALAPFEAKVYQTRARQQKNAELSTSSKTDKIASRDSLKKDEKMDIDEGTVRVKRSAIPPSNKSSEGDISKMTATTRKRKRPEVEELDKEDVEQTPPPTKKTNNLDELLIKGTFKAPMSKNIQKEYNDLVKAVQNTPSKSRTVKKISGTGGMVSVADLVAYQIGWGKRVIEWYENGIKGKKMDMPGDGFTTWSYTNMAIHFYKAYQYDSGPEQDAEFQRIASRIIDIVEKEYQTGNLEKEGVWDWATLNSGKQWPLSKWVQVNTVAPYKKATGYVKKAY